METPTPYSLHFVCRGADGTGCRCKSGFDPDTAQVLFVAADLLEHPMYGRFLCANCRASEAFDTTAMDTLHTLQQMQTLTKYQKGLLKNLRERRNKRLEWALQHNRANVSGSAPEVTRGRTRQDEANLSEEMSEANKQRQKSRDAERKENGTLANAKYKKCKNGSVRYPLALFRRMCMALVLYLRQYGRRSFDTEKVNDLLKAVLIEYNVRHPGERVVEYYVHEKGSNLPVFFHFEFDKVIKCYMQKRTQNGKPSARGRQWFSFERVVSDGQIHQAVQARAAGTNATDAELIESVVTQAFANNNNWFVPEDKRGPGHTQVRFSEKTTSNYKDNPDIWRDFTQGTVLSYTT